MTVSLVPQRESSDCGILEVYADGHRRTMPKHRTLATIVREAREAAGLSQPALANEVGVTKLTILNIENGHKPTSLVTMVRLCEVLDFTQAERMELLEAAYDETLAREKAGHA